MMSKLYETTSPDGHRLRLDRIDGVLFLVVHDGRDRAVVSGNLAYISNAQREDMIKGVKEWLARLEGLNTDPPGPRAES